MRRLKLWAALAPIAILVATPSLAFANTAPNSFTPLGTSWIDAPNKVYLESFGTDIGEVPLFYVPIGNTCTEHGVTASGPFLTQNHQNNGSMTCSQGSLPSYSSRANAIPFGFTINFFGQNYSSAWPTTFGGVFFGQPDGLASKTMPNLISSAASNIYPSADTAAMFPFAADLEFDHNFSTFWTAQTTIDSHPAVVFSWENFVDPLAVNPQTTIVSFQLVLINTGGTDFNAYYNYDRVVGISAGNGYQGPVALVDLANGVTVGSNIARSTDAKSLPSGCTAATDANWLGNTSQGVQNPFSNVQNSTNSWAYFKKETDSTISLWENQSCTTPLLVTNLQNVNTNGAAYLELKSDPNNSPIRSVAIGWGTFKSSTQEIDWTELQRNVDISSLVDGQPNSLITQKLNTTVPGRYVIGQRSGQTVTTADAVSPNGGNTGGGSNSSSNSTGLSSPTSSTVSTLAETGFLLSPFIVLTFFLFGTGAGLLFLRRHKLIADVKQAVLRGRA